MNRVLEKRLNTERESLNQSGFVHIKNAIEESSVLKVREMIDALFDRYQSLSDKHASIHGQEALDTSSREIYEINKAVRIAGQLKNSEVFRECNLIANQLLNKTTFYSYDHAIYKSPNSGHIQWHQDQAYKQRVKVMQSVHLWIPLHDISGDCGGMRYVSGSHKLPLVEHTKHRVSHTLSAVSSAIDESQIVACEASLGDVIAHLPNTLHSSTPNQSANTRKAWIIHFSPYGQLEPLLPGNLINYFFRRAKREKQVELA